MKKTKTLTNHFLKKSSWEELEHLFRVGRVPSSIDGFYKGKLLVTHINPFTDFLMRVLKNRLIPWKGKSFDGKKKRGVNIVSKKAAILFRLQHPSYIVKYNGHAIEAFPFKTTTGASLTDKKKKVFLVNYDNPKNPAGVRKVVDELILVGKNLLLGRAQLKNGRTIKTLAYFYLQK